MGTGNNALGFVAKSYMENCNKFSVSGDPQAAFLIEKLLKIADFLLSRGSIINMSGPCGRIFDSDLYLEFVKILIKNGFTGGTGTYYCTRNDNITRLLLPTSGSETRIRELLAYLAKIKKSESIYVWHPRHYCLDYLLHEAAEAGDLSRVQTILTVDQDILNREDETRVMPIHYAAAKGHLSIVNALCSKLAIVDSGTDFGLLPLHCAAVGGHTDVLQVLLQHDLNEEQKHTTLDIRNIHGLTPLHAAIMAGKVKAALLLLAAGANRELKSTRNLSPLDYIFMNKKSHDYFLPVSTIDSIVKQHSAPSVREDDQSQLIIIEKTFDTLSIHGEIVSSLQQVRGGDDLTSYCGYYALYNALAMLNFDAKAWRDAEHFGLNFGVFDKNDRKKFISFFQWALQFIAEKRKIGSLGYLLTKELRDLVSILCPEEPIVVLEKNHLKMIADGIARPEEVFDEHNQIYKDEKEQKRLSGEQTRELELLRSFSNGTLDHIVIVAGIGTDVGHWITIYAQRKQDGIVSLKIADSLRLVRIGIMTRRLSKTMSCRSISH